MRHDYAVQPATSNYWKPKCGKMQSKAFLTRRNTHENTTRNKYLVKPQQKLCKVLFSV